jgi:Tfp pilus assembly protein PilF
MKLLKIVCITLILFNLISCVMETTRSTQDAGVKVEKIEIDSDVEDDFNQALNYIKAENYDAAISLLEKVIAVESRVPAPFVNLGMAYSKKGDVVNAEKYLRMAVNVDLTHPVANNQLGLLYRKKGRFDDARKAYTNALTKYPDYLPVVKNLGILCDLYQRDFACAVTQYEHYLDLQPDNKTMKIWLADLNRRMK